MSRMTSAVGPRACARRARWALVLLIASAGCISSRTVTTVPGSGGHSWSGTGRISRDHRGMVAALEGQRLFLSPGLGAGPDIAKDVSQPLYSEPYTLKSIAQTVAFSLHESTWLHAEVPGQDNLTIFHGVGWHFRQFVPVTAQPDLAVFDDGAPFIIRRICDMAGLDTGNSDLKGGRLFLSVIACSPREPSHCTAAVLEADFAAMSTSAPTWRVKGSTAATMQSVIRDDRHVNFGGECLSLATTGRDPFRNHYLAVASPATGRILLYRAGALHEGPVAVRPRTRGEGERPVDITLMRNGEDALYLSALWKGSGAVLETYAIVREVLTAEPRLIESVPLDSQMIESSGWVAASPIRDIFVFGSGQVMRHEYDLSSDGP